MSSTAIQMKRLESFPGFHVDFSIFVSVFLFLSISIKNVPFERKKLLFLSSFLPFPKLLYQTHSHMHFKSLCNNVGVLVTTSYDESRLYFISMSQTLILDYSSINMMKSLDF